MSRFVVQATWDDAPHLTQEQKDRLWESIPPHQRDARARGIPSIGSGVIYPVAWEDVEVKPFAIPAFWRRAYALDVGWNRTAAMWGAQDPADGAIYCYAEHYRGQAEPIIHAEAIKARGEWIRGAIDPAARGRAQKDGERLIETYKASGLKIVPAINEVEAGIYEIWQRLATGRLKFFSTLQHTRGEYRLYRRDAKGQIVKKDDHLMDALRYLVMTWDRIASVQAPTSTISSGPIISDASAGY